MKIKGGGGGGGGGLAFTASLAGSDWRNIREVLRYVDVFPTQPPHALLRMVDNASQQTVMRRLRHKAVIIGISLRNEVGSGSLMSSYLYLCQVCTCYLMPYPAIVLTVQREPLTTYWMLQTDRAFFAVHTLCLFVPLGLMFRKPSTLHTLTCSCSRPITCQRGADGRLLDGMKSARSPIHLTFQWITWKNRSCLFIYAW